MKIIQILNYDKYHSFGTDWVTEYKCLSDIDLPIDEAINELKKLGHDVCGEITKTYDKSTKELIIKAVMY